MSATTLEAVRKVASSRQPVDLLDEVNSYAEVKNHKKQLDTSIVKAERENEVRRYVVVSRKMKAFDETVGLHDSLRLVVREDGGFKLSHRPPGTHMLEKN